MIKIGILVSYDYKYLDRCIKCLYEHADQITLCIDKNRKTWTGEKYILPSKLFSRIDRLDIKNKINIYEDNFYIQNMSPIESDTRQRNMLAKFMGSGGWHLQIDSDEYFVNFAAFTRFLKERNSFRSCVIYANWLTLFKINDEGIFYIKSNNDNIPIATNNPNYIHARAINESNSIVIYTDALLLHQSWARERSEIILKVRNWSHSSQINKEKFIGLWDGVKVDNYKKIRNFHPLHAKMWPALDFFGGQLDELLLTLKDLNKNIEISSYNKNSYNYFLRKLKNVPNKIKNLFS
jgi:hypothetical protein